MPTIQIVLEGVEYVCLHGPLLVLIEGVPADAHDHSVYRAPVHRGKAPIDPSHKFAGQLSYHLVRKVGRGKAYIEQKISHKLYRICIRDVPDIQLAGYLVSGRIPDVLCQISSIRLSTISGRISDSADSKHVQLKQGTLRACAMNYCPAQKLI